MGKSEQKSHSSTIPMSLRDPVVILSTKELDSNNRSIPTVLFGIITASYPETTWNSEKEQIKQLFSIDNEMCVEVKARPQEASANKVNSDILETNTIAAIKKLNSLNVEIVRIVLLGDSWSKPVDEAVENLLKGWDQDLCKKNVQLLVTIANNSKLEYCKRLCLMKVCGTVQYCHTTDYNKLGNITLTKSIDDVDLFKLFIALLIAITSSGKVQVFAIVLLVLLSSCGLPLVWGHLPFALDVIKNSL